MGNLRGETIALGPFAKENGILTMFHWDWSSLGGGKVRYIYNGGTPNPIKDGNGLFTVEFHGSTSFDYWSGGEVNQITGQIYFTGGELQDLNTDNNNFRMMLATPITSGNAVSFTKSGKIEPKTESDRIQGSNANYNGYVASDMAIDADGNAYLLVGIDDEPPFGSSGGDYFWIVKVEPSTTGNWKYSRIKKIENLQGTLTYGMSFLNGKLYAATHLGSNLYEIDPLLGTYKDQGSLTGSSKKKALDLATCQVATAITGKVYLDYDGDGVIRGDEPGIPNVVVAIYNKNGNYLGNQLTSGDGSYSFLSNDVGRSDSVLYIRLQQPQYNSANTRQTWASGGNYSWTGVNGIRGTNTAEPACYNNATNKHLVVNATNSPYPNQHKYYYGITCYGANENGIDVSTPTNLGVTNGKLNGAAFYTKITMPTDRANVRADFALAPVDRSDAPQGTISSKSYNFGKTSHTRTKDAVFLGHNIN
ncbi:MAG: hypothetical protein LBI78_05890, partial [Campylobacteraceae bacterium]|nr:hypothetical protein [Campylobacteraceae bacterium]